MQMRPSSIGIGLNEICGGESSGDQFRPLGRMFVASNQMTASQILSTEEESTWIDLGPQK